MTGTGDGEEEPGREDGTAGQAEDGRIHCVAHHQQRYHWDCGLSCCLMLLTEDNRKFVLSNLNKFVEEEGFGESTWTIDLCYILHRFHVSFRYTTITVGVDPGYVKENFYDKVLKKDSGRVNSRFAAAGSKGMLVEERSVAQEEIVSHLQRTGPVILLTNANLLSCTKCSNYISCYPSCFSSVAYQGHYILLVGYLSSCRQFVYRNPTVRDRLCQIPAPALEEARTAYGTDEDVMFIFPKG